MSLVESKDLSFGKRQAPQAHISPSKEEAALDATPGSSHHHLEAIALWFFFFLFCYPFGQFGWFLAALVKKKKET